MKKILLYGFLLLLGSFLFPETQEALKTTPGNITLQVYDGHKFVNHLTINDIAVYESGREMEINGLYLIEGSKIKRTEGESGATPKFSRNIILDFQATEYGQKMGTIVEYFINRILRPGDQVAVMTPIKNYGFSQQTLQKYTQEQLINAVLSALKRDISTVGTSYQDIMNEMIRLIKGLGAGEDMKNSMVQYRQNLNNLESLRKINLPTLLKAAEEFKKQTGQNYLFLFYQQEFIPTPDRNKMEELRKNQDILFEITELFETDKTDEPLGMDEILQVYSDAGIIFHFIYIQKNVQPPQGIMMREHSVDMFNIFSKLAKATGGVVETTATPEASFRKIAESTETYYLVSYTSTESKKDGTFRNIEVKVKNKDYKVMHRMGYFDN